MVERACKLVLELAVGSVWDPGAKPLVRDSGGR